MNETELKEISRQIRNEIIEFSYKTKSAHIASNFSMVEVLTALYFEHLSVAPDKKFDSSRDRFILSKGHACLSLYIVLYKLGFISKDILDGFSKNNGTLEHHPRRNLEMGIEMSTGSLGHGLSVGAGIALGIKKDNLSSRVYVLMSDGEIEEGAVWEAALFSGHHGLDNLVAIVDYNKIQALGSTKDILDLDPLLDKFRAFKWEVVEIDGHDYGDIRGAYSKIPFKLGKPGIIVAHTIKGKGVSFMENNLLWHYRTPDKDEYEKALNELSKKI